VFSYLLGACAITAVFFLRDLWAFSEASMERVRSKSARLSEVE